MEFNRLIADIKRGKTPAHRAIRAFARVVIGARAPRIPSPMRPLFRFLYEAHFGTIILLRGLRILLYDHPLFQGRCQSFGRGVVIDGLPHVSGHTEIHIGNNVYIGGKVTILSGRLLDRPTFVMKDHAEVGWNTSITVASEVVIEEYARVSFDCRISDTDGHPRQADLRAANLPVALRDIKPVRICKYAWIGNGSHIMKGVTIGEGAIVAANSVVISDVPPYSLVFGNPAEVFLKNFGRPSKNAAAGAGPPSGAAG